MVVVIVVMFVRQKNAFFLAKTVIGDLYLIITNIIIRKF